MLSFIEFGSDKILGVHMSGEISDGDYDAVKELTEKRLNEYPKLRIYVELEGFEGMSLKSYLKDFKLGIKHWDRFEKEAVVSKKEWHPKLMNLSDELFTRMKVFSFDEKERAKEWIQE